MNIFQLHETYNIKLYYQLHDNIYFIVSSIVYHPRKKTRCLLCVITVFIDLRSLSWWNYNSAIHMKYEKEKQKPDKLLFFFYHTSHF